MPMQSQKQRAFLWSQHPDIARIFEDHTPKGTKLPVRVAPKKESPVKPTKEAFVKAVMEKAAASGVTTQRELLTFVEKIASMCEAVATKKASVQKKAFGFGDSVDSAIGRMAAFPVMTGAAGLVGAGALGYAGGHLMGSAKNKAEEGDMKTLRTAALANAYRRRAAEAKTNAQVRELVASDPSKYVVLG